MRNGLFSLLATGVFVAGFASSSLAADKPAHTKKIVMIGMDRDHGPGEHEYMAGLKILAECLKQNPAIRVEVIKDWPKDNKVLEDANIIVCFLRAGGDYLLHGERRAAVEEIMKKGAGFVALHWAVEGKKEVGAPYMAMLGGYYEPGYSKNPTNTAKVRPADPEHPIARGWTPFEARDEFYYNIRLLPDAKPIIVSKLDGQDETIGWAFERKQNDGPLGPGRSFGFTGCHFHSNFGIPEFRRLIVNAILWTADVDVPKEGAAVKLQGPVPKIPKPTTDQ
jgi:type 1 glutamine amidotransferase